MGNMLTSVLCGYLTICKAINRPSQPGNHLGGKLSLDKIMIINCLSAPACERITNKNAFDSNANHPRKSISP